MKQRLGRGVDGSSLIVEERWKMFDDFNTFCIQYTILPRHGVGFPFLEWDFCLTFSPLLLPHSFVLLLFMMIEGSFETRGFFVVFYSCPYFLAPFFEL